MLARVQRKLGSGMDRMRVVAQSIDAQWFDMKRFANNPHAWDTSKNLVDNADWLLRCKITQDYRVDVGAGDRTEFCPKYTTEGFFIKVFSVSN